MKRFCLFLLIIALLPSFSLSADPAENKRVLCTTFPLYQLTRNVTRGVEGLEVDLMIPAAQGCPHHYSLTPGDIRRIAAADILVVNGLGMEEFLGPSLKHVNPDILVIDSSRGLEGLIRDGHADSDQGHGSEAYQEAHSDHQHDVNPHLFASPAMASRLVMNIGESLAGTRPGQAEPLRRNAHDYAQVLDELATEFKNLGTRLAQTRIVTQHGAFDYLARDTGLEIVATLNQQGGDALSAAGMINLVRMIKECGVGALFTEPQYPQRVGKALAAETGLPVGELDPVASGPEDAPLDYYEQVMRRNLEVLEESLGVK